MYPGHRLKDIYDLEMEEIKIMTEVAAMQTSGSHTLSDKITAERMIQSAMQKEKNEQWQKTW